MRLSGITFFTLNCLVSVVAKAAAPAAGAAEGATLNYDVDAALTYIDSFRRPSAGMITNPAALAVSDVRAPGLRRLRLGVDWHTVRGGELRLVFRPDAVNRSADLPAGERAREFDSRSGGADRSGGKDSDLPPMPEVRLLDAYEWRLKASPEFAASIGVFEGFIRPSGAYPELFDFALKPRLPAKFSAAALSWELHAEGSGEPPHAPPPGANFYIFQGNEDRVEQGSYKRESFDTAPSAKDPYYGGAATFAMQILRHVALDLLAGYADSAAPSRGNRIFADLMLGSALSVAGKDLKIGLDLRYARDKRRGVGMRTDLSSGVTFAVPLTPETAYLLGGSYGRSDHWRFDQEGDEAPPITGYQVETGFGSRLAEALYLEFLVTQEYRKTKNEAGQATPGFVDDTGRARLIIHRMGLELTYLLNQNA